MIYVISSGEYSDYILVAVLEADAGQEMNDLAKTFIQETGIWDSALDMGYVEKQRELWSIEYGFDRTWSNGNVMAAPPAAIFVEWLVRNHGFRHGEWQETNLDGFNI